MTVSTLALLATIAAPFQPVEIDREFRGVWVATVDNIDWPSKPGLPVAKIKSELVAILDKCKEVNLNAVVLQVRPSADAFYRSKLEPWSWYLTGEQGTAPTGDFDPLQFAIEESHRRGLELHAWCNPYRALHPAQKGPVSPGHLSVTDPTIVKTYGTYLWMDPGEKKVQDRTFDVFMDLATRYDLDGIHIDDYFYPYPVQKDGEAVPFPDQESYGRYRQQGGTLGLSDWRRKNVDDLIERFYKALKAKKPHVKFGISPFGIYRPNVPAGIKAGIDQYDALYADCKRWLNEGWCDYMSPQLYWPIAQTPQSFPVLLDWWVSQNSKGRHVWPGQYTSRTDPSGGNWKATEVTDQIRIVRQTQGATGTLHFSMKAVMNNWNGIADWLKKAYNKPALVPASPWLTKTAPKAPRLTLDRTKTTVSAVAPNARFFIYQVKGRAPVVTAERTFAGTRKGELSSVSVRVVDKYGQVSPPSFSVR